MPTRSPGNEPGATIRDLGLPGRAVTALSRAGVTGVEELAVLTRRDLAAINGLGPGLIAAIRLVVPEPSAGVPAHGSPAAAGSRELPSAAAEPEPDAVEAESPSAPAIPSFDSLRSPRRGSAIDLLVPGPPPAPPAPPRRAEAPRPAEYADLLRLGKRLVHAVSELAWQSVREPARCLRQLLGG
jgi:RNA polymerase alpha subunit